jgi:hypothetical protein
MRIVLTVTSSNEHWNGGCEFALVDLTPELTALALRRIAALRERKEVDPDIDEVYYWAYSVDCYFDPWAESSIDDKEVEGTDMAVEDMLTELHIVDSEVVCVSERFLVPPSQRAAVECEEMIVRQDSIAFTAIPKHSSVRVHTAEIPLAMLEAAAAPCASPSCG